MDAAGLVLVGLVIAVGLVGIVIPVLPGLPLSWAAVLVWALLERTTIAWITLAVATTVVAASQIVKVAVPGRRLLDAGVPVGSIGFGAALGVVGFFVVPVVGLVLGFALGVYAAERLRIGSHATAWQSTVHVLKAIGLSILIELAAGLLLAGAWLGAVAIG